MSEKFEKIKFFVGTTNYDFKKKIGTKHRNNNHPRAEVMKGVGRLE
jgi:hypothetical protein